MLLVLKSKLAIKAAMLLVAPLAVMLGGPDLPNMAPASVSTVVLKPASFAYRLPGEFTRAGRPVNAPLQERRLERPLAVMTTLVSAADYDRCAADRACEPRPGREPGRADIPAVGVSWRDATAYARWFAVQTGKPWRLPTDAEWAFAAGSRYSDDAVAADDGTEAFSKRWLARYDQEAARERETARTPRPFGSFGVNENGLADMAGNVWEWTSTCYERHVVDASGEPRGPATANCGVRIAEGAHRSYVADFIRDARAGGCAVGVPPSALGFRLVLDVVPVRRSPRANGAPAS